MIGGISLLTIGLVGGICVMAFKPEWVLAVKDWVKSKFNDVSKF
jgi:hypothetical protein